VRRGADDRAVSVADRARARLDAKTKPRGSLGRLEELAVQIASIVGEENPGRLEAAVVVAAGDHGVADEGVSAYPQEVTRQMVSNFGDGGAAVSVLARQAGARVVVVDAGVGNPTGNIAVGPALSRAETDELVARGRADATRLREEGVRIVVPGEMGIANSTVAAALAAALTGVDAADVCGPGTGLAAAGVARKIDVVRRALAANPVDASDGIGVLAALGGRELAYLAGLVVGAHDARMVVLLDGFISSTAALAATRIDADAASSLIAAHRSPEPGHTHVLAALGLRPLLELDLRLGEGSGGALALPLLAAALAILDEMATFEDAGVTDAGR
jgi:nicotinate-nucleotide--dimethylbenzimidazole phosphoribosyltransferase